MPCVLLSLKKKIKRKIKKIKRKRKGKPTKREERWKTNRSFSRKHALFYCVMLWHACFCLASQLVGGMLYVFQTVFILKGVF